MTRHPSQRRLQAWLDDGGPRRVDRHVGECEDCQQELDVLSALDDSTVSDLVAATEPPVGLTERVAEGVDTRLRDQAAATAFADLFIIGWDFIRCIVDPDPNAVESTDAHDEAESADEELGGAR